MAGFSVESYRVQGVAARAAAKSRKAPAPRRLKIASNGAAHTNGARLHLLTTMATWCKTCKGELPQLALLRRAFSSGELEMLGLPVDEDDRPADLDEYAREHSPATRRRRHQNPVSKS